MSGEHHATQALGAFVMLVVSAAVGFLLWYTVVREAEEIQPLVPALQSWWMKLHVPANFIGYWLLPVFGDGWLRVSRGAACRADSLAQAGPALSPLGVILCIEPIVFPEQPDRGNQQLLWKCILVRRR